MSVWTAIQGFKSQSLVVGTTTQTCAVTGVTAGNLLVLTICASGNTTITISDNASPPNTWVLETVGANESVRPQIFTCILKTGGSFTVTAKLSTTDYPSICIEEFNFPGMAAIATDGGTNSASGTGTAVASGTITTANTDLLICAIAVNTLSTLTATGSWTLAQYESYNTNTAYGVALMDQLNATATTVGGTATLGTSVGWNAVVIAFTAIPAVPSTTYSITGQGSIAPSQPGLYTVTPSGANTVTLTWSDGGMGGTFSPVDNVWSNSAALQQFTYSNPTPGIYTLTATSVPALNTNPSITVMVRESETFYVSSSGSDSNNGMSSSSPWLTISHVNSQKFVAGDAISFNSGNSFSGTLTLSNTSGVPGMPIVISSYGTGQATISAGNNDGIQVFNSEYITINNLILSGATPTGSGASLVSTSVGVGIKVLSTAQAGGANWRDITITNCTITGFQTGHSLGAVGPGGAVLACNVNATAGTFTVTVGSQTTPAQNWNVPLATLQTAVDALSTVGSGNCTVTGSVGNYYILTFATSLGSLTLSANTSGITGYPFVQQLSQGGYTVAAPGYNGYTFSYNNVSNSYLSLMNSGAQAGIGSFLNGYIGYNKFHGLSGCPGCNENSQGNYVAPEEWNGITIEYNQIYNNGVTALSGSPAITTEGFAALCCNHNTNFLVQYNEIWNTQCGNNADGFALDVEQSGTGTVRYNYFHDNQGSGIQVHNSTGVTYVYGNVCARNMQLAEDIADIAMFGTNGNTYIYNNTSYLDTTYGTNYASCNVTLTATGYAFNNIFVGNGISYLTSTTTGTYLNNLYWNSGSFTINFSYPSLAQWQTIQEHVGATLYGVKGDPLFSNKAGGYGAGYTASGWGIPLITMPYFALGTGSAAIGHGVSPNSLNSAITNPTVDFGGNPYQYTTIGAYESTFIGGNANVNVIQLSASGNTQATATQLPSYAQSVAFVVGTVPAGSGISLYPSYSTINTLVINNGANALTIYPPPGGSINGQSPNIPITLSAGSKISLWSNYGSVAHDWSSY